MGVFDDVKLPQSQTGTESTGGVFSSVKTPTPQSTSSVFSSIKPAPVIAAPKGGVFGSITTSTPKVSAPKVTPSPYFEGYEPSGVFLGISTQKDPYSGRPLFAYKVPGQATTTDTTRTAPKINPEKPVATPRDTFTNERMPESASQAVRVQGGATKDQQLDHQMALSVGGSNDKSNLKLVPTKENQAAGAEEATLSREVSQGKISLFEAQRQEAKNKGLPLPFTDQEIKQQVAQDPSWWSKILSSSEHTVKGALTGIFNTVASSGPVERAEAAYQSVKTGSFKPLAESFNKQFTEMNTKVDPFSGQAQNMDYVDPKKQAMFIPKGALDFAEGSLGHGEEIVGKPEVKVPNQLEHEVPQPSPKSGPVNPTHVDAYIKQFGNEVNTDNARELFPAYQADRTTSADVHEPASDIAKAAYEKLLTDNKGEGNNTVLFTAGGTGAGKTSAIRTAGMETEKYPVIYDTNSNKLESATSKIEDALKNGYNVKMMYVHNDIETSLNNALERAERMTEEKGSGRTVPLKEHLNTHLGAPSSFVELAKKYADDPRVEFGAIDNEKNLAKGFVDNPVDFVESKVYNEAHERSIKAKLHQQINQAYTGGQISDGTFRGFTRNEEPGPGNVQRATGGQESRQISAGKLSDRHKISVNTLKSISVEKNPFEISKILQKEVPNLSEKTRDYISSKLVGMTRTSDIEGLLHATKKAERAVSDREGVGASGERRGSFPQTIRTVDEAATSRIKQGTEKQTPTAESPETRAKNTLPKSIGELLSKQESNSYIDSITKSIKDKESAVLAQQEYNAMWEQADQKVIDRANELSIMKEMLTEQVGLHPGKKLIRYATDGKLPEVTGKSTKRSTNTGKMGPNSEYGRRGDDIAGELGFESDVAAQKGLDDYIQMRDQLHGIEQELREVRPRARAAQIIQGMVDEVPVVAQEKAGEIETLATADDVRKYKDISGFMGQARDVYRNFEAFFGKRFEDVKKSILDPFDKSKGDMVDEIKKLGDELDAGVVSKYNIKRGSKKAQAIMDWGEREIVSRGERVPGMNFEYTTQDGLIKTFGRDGAKDVMDAERWFRTEYNRLVDEANDVRAKIYPNDPSKLIPHRRDYFRHYKELGNDFAALRDLIENAAGIHPGIDPTLAGVSEFTSPKSKFLSFAKERIGQGSSRDAIAGFLDYAPAFSYMKHIDPHIGVFRYLRRILAENAPTPGVTESLEGGSVKTKQKGINNFLEYLNDFSNNLAGKTNPLDRYFQKVIPGGRTTMRVIDWINSRVKANQILGNLSSSVAQAFNVPQGIGSAKLYSLPGLQRTLASIFTENEPMKASNFIKERFMQPIASRFNVDWLEHPVKGTAERGKELAAWTMQALDEVGTKFIWNSHYAKGVAEGRPDPIKYADDVTRKMVAGRGVGEVPLIQKSKMFQIVAPFQVEVGNAWFAMKDMISAKDFVGLVTFFLASYLMNNAAQQIRGSKVVFDPINSLMDGATQAADEMKTTGNPWRAGFKFAGRQAGEILSNVPLGQSIAAAAPDSFVQTVTGLAGAPMNKQELFGSADPGRFGGGILAVSGIQDPLYKLVLPFGGAQVERTQQGIEAMLKGSVNDSKGKLAYTIKPTVANVTRAFLFGKNATTEAQNYFATRDDLFSKTFTQTAARTQTTMNAEAKWAELKTLSQSKGQDSAAKAFDALTKSDSALATKVGEIAAQDAKGINGNDRLILMLGVKNGERAKFLSDQFNGLKTQEEKAALWDHMIKVKAITPQVSKQLQVLLNP